jgi:hypothetical protein
VAAALSAAGAALVARHSTPVDAALPFIVVVITAVASVTHPSLQLAVPLLIGGEMAIAGEQQRLLWFGVVVACAFASAAFAQQRAAAAGRATPRTPAPFLIATAAILLLRWIPISEVSPGRETALILSANAIVFVLGGTPLSIAAGVAAALFTPAYPLRTLGIAAGVLAVAALARLAGAAKLKMAAVPATALAVMLLFFAWSGAFARALPLMLRGGPPLLERERVQIALAAGQWAEVDVPPNGRALILSGANVPRLKRGTPMGSIEPGSVTVAIGDVADWGFLRREHYFNARNPLPRRPGGLLRGYGQTAWIDASGRLPVRPGRVRVTADRNLPPGAMLQIDAIEIGE